MTERELAHRLGHTDTTTLLRIYAPAPEDERGRWRDIASRALRLFGLRGHRG